jgi:hypothetical protein
MSKEGHEQIIFVGFNAAAETLHEDVLLSLVTKIFHKSIVV